VLRSETAKAAAEAAVAAEAEVLADGTQALAGRGRGSSSSSDGGHSAAATAAAAAAVAGTGAVTARSLQKEARRLYRRALELNPKHPVANHALTALEATAKGALPSARRGSKVRAVPSEASAEYVGALFDSYATEFDASLAALGYQV
jgi:predicted TPR repeat methyltransferase